MKTGTLIISVTLMIVTLGHSTYAQNVKEAVDYALYGPVDTISQPDSIPLGFPLIGAGGGGDCNVGCGNGSFEFEDDILLAANFNGSAYAPYVDGQIPGNLNNFPGIFIDCVQTSNMFDNTPPAYAWSINHNAIGLPQCQTNSGVPCLNYSMSTLGSSIDLISESPNGSGNNGLHFGFNGVNPATSWNPCDPENRHYLRFCASDGIRQETPTANCPLNLRDINEFSEAVKFSGAGQVLQAGEEYVLEFMTCSNPLLLSQDNVILGNGTVDASLSYFISAANPLSHRGFSTFNNCQLPNGTFVPNGVTTAWTHDYGAPLEWQRVVTEFTAQQNGAHHIYFSPNTPLYHTPDNYEWMNYFLDDIQLTPINLNPVSAEVLINGQETNGLPVVFEEGELITITVTLSTNWTGFNSNIIFGGLEPTPGLSNAPNVLNAPITIPMGNLGPQGLTFEFSYVFNSQAEQGVVETLNLVLLNACLSHVPCIEVIPSCSVSSVTTSQTYPNCFPTQIVAEVDAPNENFEFQWTGPDGFISENLVESVSVSGIYTAEVFSVIPSCAVTSSLEVSLNAMQIPGFAVNGTANNIDNADPVYLITSNVYIPADQTWTVSMNEVYFAPDVMVVIHPKGRFDLIGAELNAGCDEQWGGIVIEGVSALPQQIANQGYLNASLSKIANAQVAVSCQGLITYLVGNNIGLSNATTMGNGIARVVGCRFENNARDVFIRGAEPFANSVARADRFMECHFEVNENYYESATLPLERVRLWNNGGVLFRNCVFENNDSQRLLSHAMTGILAYKASPVVRGTSVEAPLLSSFSGFTYGIRANQSGGPGMMQVRNTLFSCYRGLYTNTVQRLHVLNNEFLQLDEEYPYFPMLPNGISASTDMTVQGHYGVYLNGVQANQLFEGNRFFAQPLDNQGRNGLIVRNNSTSPNYTIYRNYFEGHTFACRFLDRNRSSSSLLAAGLKFRCNEYVNCGFSTYIAAAGPGVPDTRGISPFQGSSTSANGNQFTFVQTPDLLPAVYQHIWRLPSVSTSHIYYIRESSELAYPSEMTVISEQVASVTPAANCPIIAGVTVDSNQKAAVELSLVGLNTTREFLVDGGDTEQLITDIKQWSPEVNSAFEALLLDVSPYLSEEAVLELLNKEDSLSAAVLTTILAYNPHALRCDSVYKLILHKDYNFSSWMVDLIEESQHILGQLGALDASISELQGRLDLMESAELYLMLEDSTNQNIAFLQSRLPARNAAEALYQRLLFFLDCGDSLAAQTCLDSLLYQSVIEAYQKTDLFNTDILIKNNHIFNPSDAPLSPVEKNLLESMVAQNLPLSSGLALARLEQQGFYIPEVLEYPELRSERSLNALRERSNEKPSVLHLFPNPSADLLYIRPLVELKGHVQVIVSNAAGQIVYTESATAKQKLFVLDVSALPGAAYTLSIRDEANTYTEQFIKE
jgi:hypothetical protein